METSCGRKDASSLAPLGRKEQAHLICGEDAIEREQASHESTKGSTSGTVGEGQFLVALLRFHVVCHIQIKILGQYYFIGTGSVSINHGPLGLKIKGEGEGGPLAVCDR